ncbi:tol-pal system protein YbgF [Pseudomonas sp. MYb118]|uniref:tol-pal system protein YbgF n=1 Tax=Pseudomonas sp. MYb118 TaxID=1848720 RepID=UPI0034D011E1
MRTCRRAVTILALSLAPLAAWAAVPVVDNDSGYDNSGSNSPPAGYGTNGAYAGGGVTAPASAQGMLFNQLQQMQDQISRQQGVIEELQNQVSRMKQESLERYQDLDRRIGSGVAPAATPENSSTGGDLNAPGAAAGAGAGAAAAATQAPAAGSEPADPAKEKLYYDAAFDLIKAKDFDKASQAFSAFLRKYPNSQYAGNAQYWLGEVNLAKGDLQGAGQAFAKVSQLYPKHNKVPDSLYKLADVERRLGHPDKVKGILQQVVSQYPGTSAAQLAQRDLQRM